jgi:ABC-type phosphate transport system auxiliary subunit
MGPWRKRSKRASKLMLENLDRALRASMLKKPSVEKQIKDMHDQLQAEMQSQINQLKLQLRNSIAQLQGAKQQAAAANAAAAQAQLQAQQQQQQTAENIAAVSNLQSSHKAPDLELRTGHAGSASRENNAE